MTTGPFDPASPQGPHRCPACGAEPGAPAPAPTAPASTAPAPPAPAPSPPGRGPGRKSPFVAAILNLYLWGAGYLYAGRLWGLVILIPYLWLSLAGWLVFLVASPRLGPLTLLVSIPMAVASIAFAWHAHRMVSPAVPQVEPARPQARPAVGRGRAHRRMRWVVIAASVFGVALALFLYHRELKSEALRLEGELKLARQERELHREVIQSNDENQMLRWTLQTKAEALIEIRSRLREKGVPTAVPGSPAGVSPEGDRWRPASWWPFPGLRRTVRIREAALKSLKDEIELGKVLEERAALLRGEMDHRVAQMAVMGACYEDLAAAIDREAGPLIDAYLADPNGLRQLPTERPAAPPQADRAPAP